MSELAIRQTDNLEDELVRQAHVQQEELLELDARSDSEKDVKIVWGHIGGVMLRVEAKGPSDEDGVVETKKWFQIPIDAAVRHDALEHPFAYAAQAGVEDLRNPYKLDEDSEWEQAA